MKIIKILCLGQTILTPLLIECRAESRKAQQHFAHCMQACKLEADMDQPACQDSCLQKRCRRSCLDNHERECCNSKGCSLLLNCVKSQELPAKECHNRYADACVNNEACAIKRDCLQACNAALFTCPCKN